MRTPAIVFSAGASDRFCERSIVGVEMTAMDPAVSRSGRAEAKADTVTPSSASALGCSSMVYGLRLAVMLSLSVAYPVNRTSMVAVMVGMSMLKRPSASVTVPVTVPTIATVAPGKGLPLEASPTVPVAVNWPMTGEAPARRMRMRLKIDDRVLRIPQ